ncbi:MAG TPA: HNH endonuclease signature motif containing protein, partial [Streptosporangiaceae bacterium]|nr:HNH endonuclease signature motif containing protein [Streptosporangiaceae bacterium]
HLIEIRDRTCMFPGCRRDAAQCDCDHTLAYEHGGRTCECNLGPLCRRHHQVKQAPSWQLTQPQPGIFHWTAPSRRTYRTTADPY